MAKWTERNEDPENLGEKMSNECFIVVDRRK